MTILIDNALQTAPVRLPLTEGWVASSIPVEARAGLVASDVGTGDVALISSAEATLLAETHVVLSDVAIVVEGISPFSMRTPVRPDDVDDTLIRLIDVSGTGELLIRALLRPFYGITASSARFLSDESDPEIARAQVVVIEGIAALEDPEDGFQSDLAQAWFILTGSYVVSHVLVAGIEALATGRADEAVAVLQQAVAVGIERKREVRGIIAAGLPDPEAVDREKLAEMTNNLTYTLDADDRRSFLNLIARGTWASRYPQKNPTFREDLAADVRGGDTE